MVLFLFYLIEVQYDFNRIIEKEVLWYRLKLGHSQAGLQVWRVKKQLKEKRQDQNLVRKQIKEKLICVI